MKGEAEPGAGALEGLRLSVALKVAVRARVQRLDTRAFAVRDEVRRVDDDAHRHEEVCVRHALIYDLVLPVATRVVIQYALCAVPGHEVKHCAALLALLNHALRHRLGEVCEDVRDGALCAVILWGFHSLGV